MQYSELPGSLTAITSIKLNSIVLLGERGLQLTAFPELRKIHFDDAPQYNLVRASSLHAICSVPNLRFPFCPIEDFPKEEQISVGLISVSHSSNFLTTTLPGLLPFFRSKDPAFLQIRYKGFSTIDFITLAVEAKALHLLM